MDPCPHGLCKGRQGLNLLLELRPLLEAPMLESAMRTVWLKKGTSKVSVVFFYGISETILRILATGCNTTSTKESFFVVVANYAASRSPQDGLRQPDVAFCFISGATQEQNVLVGCTDTLSSTRHCYCIFLRFTHYWE
jgi:hypothetical protein